MATNVGGVILDTTVLDRMTAETRPNARKVVNTYGLAIAGEAAKGAPVDTGALRNSILSESQMSGDLEFTVQDGVTYGVFQELGTSRMAARPFLVPAVEMFREKFLSAFKDLFK
jgi:HK97 gp10 family phage protein